MKEFIPALSGDLETEQVSHGQKEPGINLTSDHIVSSHQWHL